MSIEPYDDTAQSVLEHADALARLDAAGRGDYETASARHIHAMRVLALPHLDPTPDRAFYKALKAASGGHADVFVEWIDNGIRFTVDSRVRRHRFMLWNRAQMARGEEDAFHD